MGEDALFHRLYSIGHSNIPIDKFISLLNQHSIQVVVDIRSHPFSKFVTHFNFDAIQAPLREASIKYLYLGKELGGMPKNPDFYDQEGKLVYAKVAKSATFQEGIARLVRGTRGHTIALMCGEENPSNCHRRHLIGPALREQNVDLLHIRAGSQVQSEFDLARQETVQNDALQLSLFNLASDSGV